MYESRRRPTLEEIDAAEANDPLVNASASTPAQLTYAWNWFSYHAQQRLTAFHFFLVVLALLTTGYVTAVEKELRFVESVLCVMGALISLAFLALDIRNEELVNDGRAALRKLERALDIRIHRRDYRQEGLKFTFLLKNPGWADRQERRTRYKHRFWLRFIEAIAAMAFCLAFGFSLARAPNSHPTTDDSIAALRRSVANATRDATQRQTEIQRCLKLYGNPNSCDCFVNQAPVGIGFKNYVDLLFLTDKEIGDLTAVERQQLERTRNLSTVCFSPP